MYITYEFSGLVWILDFKQILLLLLLHKMTYIVKSNNCDYYTIIMSTLLNVLVHITLLHTIQCAE